MASISEKLVTVAENTPKVHHAGQLNVVQSAQSLKGSESNTAMFLDDVSPVTHEMGVRIKSKNLIPFPYRDLKLGTSTYNGVDFTVYEDGSILINGTATSNTTRYLYSNVTDLLGLKSGITISANKNVSDNTQQANVYFICNYYDSAAKMQMGIQASTNASGTKTITEDWKGLGIYLHIPSGKTLNNLLIEPQLEIGTTPTAYTPYVPDLTAVKVSMYGKNLCVDINDRTDVFFSGSPTTTYSITGGQLIKGFAVNGHSTNYHITDFVNSNGTVSFKTSNVSYTIGIDVEVVQGVTYAVSANITGGTSESKPIWTVFLKDGLFQSYTTAQSFTVPNNCNQAILLIRPSAANTECSFSNVQLEFGTTVTDYEPYKECVEYTPTADGTVNGVTSLYPNTTLVTDTEGVIIDCEYYKDIDKAYNKLSAAIALSGGE